jgi:hypothetical protein
VEYEALGVQEPVEGLGPADAAALDALVEAGMDEAMVMQRNAALAQRAARIREILGLLDCHTSADPALADVTMARILKARREAQHQRQPAAEPILCPDDEEALDAWVMAGYDAARVPSALRQRARRHQAIATLVRAGRPELDRELLLDRTLAAVQAQIDKQSEGMVFEAPRPRRGSLRLADLVSVAAVLLIGSAVLFPVMTAVREQSRRAICHNNLHATAMAMSAYAGSYQDSLPVVTASLGQGRWWDVGRPQHSNSANLYTLARTGFTELANLACPGNPVAPTAIIQPDALDWRGLAEISYSYQIMFGPARPGWSSGQRTVVLADRSPVVPRAVRGELIAPFANAPNHGGAGQHVLFNDGAARWLRTPVLDNGDNIWLPRGWEIRIQQMSGRSLDPLSGRELPDAADDAFLGP